MRRSGAARWPRRRMWKCMCILYVCSDRSGWRSWCSAVWRAMADVSVPFERVGMVIETVGSSAAAGALL